MLYIYRSKHVLEESGASIAPPKCSHPANPNLVRVPTQPNPVPTCQHHCSNNPENKDNNNSENESDNNNEDDKIERDHDNEDDDDKIESGDNDNKIKSDDNNKIESDYNNKIESNNKDNDNKIESNDHHSDALAIGMFIIISSWCFTVQIYESIIL